MDEISPIMAYVVCTVLVIFIMVVFSLYKTSKLPYSQICSQLCLAGVCSIVITYISTFSTLIGWAFAASTICCGLGTIISLLSDKGTFSVFSGGIF